MFYVLFMFVILDIICFLWRKFLKVMDISYVGLASLVTGVSILLLILLYLLIP